MKIGVLTTSYPRGAADPAGHFVRGFCDWLASHVGQVEVLALDAPFDPSERLRAGGLADRVRGPRGLLRGAMISARLVAMARRRAARWDAIVSHWLLPCGLVGDLLADGRRHLAIAHGSDVDLLRRMPGGRALARRLARRADLVYVADALRIDGAPGRVVAMPPPTSLAPRTLAERQAARRALELAPVGEGPLVVLFCGRMVDGKGIELLVDALPDQALALLVGDGPLRPPPSARVRVLGPRFGAELRQAFAAADLLVVPSTRDGAPTVIGEARGAGLPVLGTAVGGIPEAIGRDGLVVSPESRALREAIAAFAADRASLPSTTPPATWAEIGAKLWGSAAAVHSGIHRHTSVIFY